MNKIYLASPLFNEKEKENIIKIAAVLRFRGYEVYVPMEHQIENAWDYPMNEWANLVFKEDVKAINEADRVVAIIYGMKDDAGTAWEIGYSFGLNKTVDVILASNERDIYSLMVLQSCDKVYNMDLEEIKKEFIMQS